jgi:hypothetical protein
MWNLMAALAFGSLGSMETAVGRYDDALAHLGELRDLGERLDSAWLAAWSRVQLGILAVARSPSMTTPLRPSIERAGSATSVSA